MLPSKSENLSRCSRRLLHVCKKLTQVNIYNIVFFNIGRGFYGSFFTLFPKAPASCCKKLLNSFLLFCTSIFISSKSVSQIFKILFQTGYIIIFVHRGGSFLVDMFN